MYVAQCVDLSCPVTSPAPPGLAHCYFKYPVTASTPRGSLTGLRITTLAVKSYLTKTVHSFLLLFFPPSPNLDKLVPPVLGNKRDEISDQMAWNRLKMSKFSDIYSLICLATVLISLQMGFKRIKADKLHHRGFGLVLCVHFKVSQWSWFMVHSSHVQMIIYQRYTSGNLRPWPKNLIGSNVHCKPDSQIMFLWFNKLIQLQWVCFLNCMVVLLGRWC